MPLKCLAREILCIMTNAALEQSLLLTCRVNVWNDGWTAVAFTQNRKVAAPLVKKTLLTVGTCACTFFAKNVTRASNADEVAQRLLATELLSGPPTATPEASASTPAEAGWVTDLFSLVLASSCTATFSQE